MIDKQEDRLRLNLIGKTIAGIICHSYYQLKDIAIIQDINYNQKVLELPITPERIIEYTIDQESIEKVQITLDSKMYLFHTHKKQYLVNDQNQIIEDSSQWSESYFEVLSSSFYRKDTLGYWYDIEGFRMKENVFLKDDTLISLETKKSKRSISFKQQELFISKNRQLIQVGKLVLNLQLKAVKYFGNKITGLGLTNITFGDNDTLQEIKLGLNETAFINEYSHQPYLIEGNKISKHTATYQYGAKRIDIFKSEEKSYGVEGRSDSVLSYNDKPLEILANNHVSFNNTELIKVSDGKSFFYFDLYKYKPFVIEQMNNKFISDIDPKYIRAGNSKLYNVCSLTDQFVINESELSIFKLDNNSITPNRIEDVGHLDKYYGYAIVDEKPRLFAKKNAAILKFGADDLEIAEVTPCDTDKFLNALDTNENKLVLDIRLGYENISMGVVENDKICTINSNTMHIGNETLLNATVEKLGGTINRVINISNKLISYHTLPNQLKQTSEEDIPSSFAGNYYSEIRYSAVTAIEENSFIHAIFTAFTGKEYSVLLEKESGNPLHLNGNGHRNELATSWVNDTIQNKYHLGHNRMIGVHTLSENLKEHTLLFSVQKQTSWLPFFDNYLPVLKQVINIQEEEGNAREYNLFELREVSKEKEYLAVEKKAPYRVLIDKKGDEYAPRIIKSKTKSIKSPEELTALQRIFSLGTRLLMEVD